MIPSRRHRVTVRAVDAYSALVEEFAEERYPHTWREMDMTQLRVEYAQALANKPADAINTPAGSVS